MGSKVTVAWVTLCAGLAGTQGVLAQQAPEQVAAQDPAAGAARESLQDAWWTGPLLAPNASAFPHGHMLVEPYVYDEITTGRYDSGGSHRPAPNEHDLGSLTYVIYALTDRLAVGLLPRFGYNEPAGEPSSSSPNVGDFGAQLQYSLTSFHEGSSCPRPRWWSGRPFRPAVTTACSARATDSGRARIRPRWRGIRRTTCGCRTVASCGCASISPTRYRALRSVADASVYGTSAGFRGHAYPGDGASADAAAEYSLTRNWVLAADLIWSHSASTRVSGTDVATGTVTSGFVNLQSGSSEYLALAPAVEFNWSPRMGVIVGARIFVAGRNTTASITPVTAINMVF